MAEVIWSQPAVAEFAILYAFIEERSPAAAARLEERVRVATLQLETFPESGRPSRQFGEARREVVVAPYLLVFTPVTGWHEVVDVMAGVLPAPTDGCYDCYRGNAELAARTPSDAH